MLGKGSTDAKLYFAMAYAIGSAGDPDAVEATATMPCPAPMSEDPPTTTLVAVGRAAAEEGAMGGGRVGKLNPTSVWSACSICKVTGT